MPAIDYFFSEEDRRKLKEAIDRTYAAVEDGKRLIREQLDGPSTMLAQFTEVQAELDKIVDSVDELRNALIHSARLNESLYRERNEAQVNAVMMGMSAYEQAWDERLNYLTRAMPESSAELIHWLSDVYERNRHADPDKLAEVFVTLEALWVRLSTEESPPTYP